MKTTPETIKAISEQFKSGGELSALKSMRQLFFFSEYTFTIEEQYKGPYLLSNLRKIIDEDSLLIINNDELITLKAFLQSDPIKDLPIDDKIDLFSLHDDFELIITPEEEYGSIEVVLADGKYSAAHECGLSCDYVRSVDEQYIGRFDSKINLLQEMTDIDTISGNLPDWAKLDLSATADEFISLSNIVHHNGYYFHYK